MANTYELISKTTVGAGGAASITFSSIPGTYTDLVVVGSCRTNSGSYVSEDFLMDLNGSSSNFNMKQLNGDGTNAGTDSRADNLGINRINEGGSTANTFSSFQYYIPNYTGGNNKSFFCDSAIENNATTGRLQLVAALWSSSAAITSITLYHRFSYTLAQYSTARLYGIKNS